MPKIEGHDITLRQLVALHGLYQGLVKANGTLYHVNVRKALDALADKGIIARTGMGAFMIPFGSPGEQIIGATPDFMISTHLWTFEATLSVTIEQTSGPDICPAHVIAWVCGDGVRFGEGWTGFTFDVCPDHESPDECEFLDKDKFATFKATVMTADLDD